MAIYKVNVNKSQMVQLLRTRGFRPTEKRSEFLQKFSPRSWELTWKEPAGQYKAVAEFAGGKLGLRIEHPGGHKFEVVLKAEMLRLGILRPEVQVKQ